ncbi:MAG: hypothetical protein K2H86_04630 [Muribaculaceae bacterium]|nr:hypothetical protein [Muribaculaceae bacterium]
MASILVCGCSRSDEPKPNDGDKIKHRKSSILIYAVASNNLSTSLQSDMTEILNAAPKLDIDNNEIFIYYLTNKTIPALYSLEYDKSSKSYNFVKKLDYDRTLFSTDPRRISNVISDYIRLTSADKRGLIFWSHGTGWLPYFSDHIVPDDINSTNSPQSRVHKSYGYDSYMGVVDQCDIIELADAIPSDTFHYIWFDCCYMGGIEVAYQLRDKADYMVGYCTEVWGDGMQYTLTMPFLATEHPDITGAAEAFANYYIRQNLAVTVGVYDLSKIEKVADIAASRFDIEAPSIIFMQNYGRSNYRFYDFGQYQKSKMIDAPAKWSQTSFDEAMAAYNDIELNAALEDFVIYKASAEIDFNRRPLSLDYFSGVTMHYYSDSSDETDEYYRQTDWFKRISTSGI